MEDVAASGVKSPAVRPVPWRDPFVVLLVVGLVVAVALYPFRLATVTGLPAHPLLVHAPVVLVPEMVLAVVVLAWRGEWRARFGFAAGAGAIVAMAATSAAVGSGKALKDRMGGDYAALTEHENLGETLRLLVIAFTIVFLVWLVLERRGAGRGLNVALTVVSIALALLSLVWLVRTGDAGARLVWEND